MSRSYRAPFLVRLISFLVPKPKSGATPTTFADAIPPASIEPSETPLTLAMRRASSPEHSGAFDLMRDLNKAVEADCFKNHLWRVCACPGCERLRTKIGAERHEARKEFGKRETPPSKRPRLGPMPYFMPDAMRDGHTMERAKSEGWETLAILDGHEWAKRCRELDENLKIAQNTVGIAKASLLGVEDRAADLAVDLERERERVELLDSKRQDQEVLIAQLEATVSALTASYHSANARAKENASMVDAAHAFLGFLQDGEHVRLGANLDQAIEAWFFHEEPIIDAVAEWKGRQENDQREAELPGATVFGSNGVRPVPIGLGCERPEPADVRSTEWERHTRPKREAPQEPRTADMAAVVEAVADAKDYSMVPTTTARHRPAGCQYEARVEEGALRKCSRLIGPACDNCPLVVLHHSA